MTEINRETLLDDLLRCLDDPTASQRVTAAAAARDAYSIFLNSYDRMLDVTAGGMEMAASRVLLARLTYLGLQAQPTLAGRALRCAGGSA
jgi:hypothetical protein